VQKHQKNVDTAFFELTRELKKRTDKNQGDKKKAGQKIVDLGGESLNNPAKPDKKSGCC